MSSIRTGITENGDVCIGLGKESAQMSQQEAIQHAIQVIGLATMGSMPIESLQQIIDGRLAGAAEKKPKIIMPNGSKD